LNNRFALTIGKKLTAAFLCMALLIGVSGIISNYFVMRLDRSYSRLIENEVTVYANVQKMMVEAVKESNSLRGYLLSGDESFLVSLQQARNNLSSIAGMTMPLVQNNEVKEKILSFLELDLTYKEAYDPILEQARKKASETAVLNLYKKDAQPIESQMTPLVNEIITLQAEQMNKGVESNNKAVASSRNALLLSSIAIILLALIMGTLISRKIAKPIRTITGAAERIAAGDLALDEIRVNRRDEIGLLAAAFNRMKANLQEFVHRVGFHSEQVAAASEQLTASAEETSRSSESIASTVQHVSAVAEQQARNVSESLQAMHELSAGVQQIAVNAQTTSDLSGQAVEKTQAGQGAIRSVEEQMSSIQETFQRLADEVNQLGDRSGEINAMIHVISEIASQTNLLALNAGIEAARAGEHGRGFEVVAGEIRKLADQSARSADEITERIHHVEQDIRTAVQTMKLGAREITEGIRAVHDAGEHFAQIKAFVEKVTGHIQEISAASQQMSAYTEQVVRTMESISEGAGGVSSGARNVSTHTEQQLAALQEISASAASLSKLSDELAEYVHRFKV
jgi:methyl-accepting chemotaxis protein